LIHDVSHLVEPPFLPTIQTTQLHPVIRGHILRTVVSPPKSLDGMRMNRGGWPPLDYFRGDSRIFLVARSPRSLPGMA
jgi:hypothetical protein